MASGSGVKVTLCGGLCSSLHPQDWKARLRLFVTPKVLFSGSGHSKNILPHTWAIADWTTGELTLWEKPWQHLARWAREFTFKLERFWKLVTRQNLKIHTGKGSRLRSQWENRKRTTSCLIMGWRKTLGRAGVVGSSVILATVSKAQME